MMCEKLKSYRKEISCINLLFKVWNKHIFKYNWQVYDAFVMKRKREQSQWSISLIIIKKEQLPLSSNSKASSWSYDRWMYNYPCNHCLSPLTWWVRTPHRRGVLDTTLCEEVCQWLATGRWFSPGTPIASTNKTDRHDITEILLKVAEHKNDNFFTIPHH